MSLVALSGWAGGVAILPACLHVRSRICLSSFGVRLEAAMGWRKGDRLDVGYVQVSIVFRCAVRNVSNRSSHRDGWIRM